MNQDYQQLLARPETVTETKINKNKIVVKQQAVAQDQNAMLSRWFQEMATRQLIKDCEAEHVYISPSSLVARAER